MVLKKQRTERRRKRSRWDARPLLVPGTVPVELLRKHDDEDGEEDGHEMAGKEEDGAHANQQQAKAADGQESGGGDGGGDRQSGIGVGGSLPLVPAGQTGAAGAVTATEAGAGRSAQQPQLTPGGFFLQDPSVAEAARAEALAADELIPRRSEKAEEDMSLEELKERKIQELLQRIQRGTPPQRKTALRQIGDKAREFGAAALFNQLLPMFMAPTLGEQERHLLVKVIDRILYRLDDLVRPYVGKILKVTAPLLTDESYFTRMEGREIISNVAKAAGLATMIATLRPNIDSVDADERNLTARTFSVVAHALGVPALLPFIKAVCHSRKSWQARHTGIKVVQQIAAMQGAGVLPHLRQLVGAIAHGLTDEQHKVRTVTALACAALAEASRPYGIESFDVVIRPLWKGTRSHSGKSLAAFLKAIGCIIPLMDPTYASFFTREVMTILIREFASPDDEMKKIVLKVVQQCVATEGVEPQYLRDEVVPSFFANFWVRRMALERRNYLHVVDATVAIAQKIGCAEVLGRLVDDLKDESEPYRQMVMQTVEKVIQAMGTADIEDRLLDQLIDGVLRAFQEQTEEEDVIVLNGFGTIINALGRRAKPYLIQIAGVIKWRLNHRSPQVRMQAADLIVRIATVMKRCEQDTQMGNLGLVLFEYLGEEYPNVLGSILGGLSAIVDVIGMEAMTPPIRDLLPRLTPILKNRNEKVQENCIDLVGRIAERAADMVNTREWLRICFQLLELLKAHKLAIRRASVRTFGFIAKAIGPHEVLHTLLNNLRVQDRQMRVCTTVAIAIVAETCAPFTVLPALMNEYRVPDQNVQNGVLKALSFMFEYIGEMGKDYIYAATPLLEDALSDRDAVHRQTAAATVKHLALGVAGLGCEDALGHLLNFVWPNIFEVSPHVINAVLEAVEALMIALGPAKMMCFLVQGLFHPARRVREVYWKIYNTLYILASDALTPTYPATQDDQALALPDALRRLGTGEAHVSVADPTTTTTTAPRQVASSASVGASASGTSGDKTNGRRQNRYQRYELELVV